MQRRAVIGIIGNRYTIDARYPVHAGGTMNSCAVARVAGAMPLIVPSDPDYVGVDELLGTCDGFLFTGGRPNVHPEEYGHPPTPAHGEFDRPRDAVTLPLIRALAERGQPFLAICRGFQEVNVAMGGTLHPEIRELPGRDNHRMPPDGELHEQFAPRHSVRFTAGGLFHRVIGAEEVMTNTLHGQGIVAPGRGVVVDGHAPDGTPEALYLGGAPGFMLSVQWHPEWNAEVDPVSRALFGTFGQAARAWAAGEGALTPQDAAARLAAAAGAPRRTA